MSETTEDPTNDITAEDLPGIRSALTRYRVMAWVVGTLLVVLTVGVVFKYLIPGYNEFGSTVVTYVGVGHGWLYLVLLITAYDLGRRLRWSIKWFIMIMLAGTVPFLSFVAEHYATKNARAIVAEVTNHAL
ncbi:DUF3817 domain-containing protein [Tessaracoccus caeni]|uniref:DUF3817 domain-containing protein n=1 Tax=Tessaracoccus caeni TaxID=3031239 RepID=UPI0023DC2D11|nr:DUF3817 domain-containing protein [Tessaracoccus caeni]MDF1487411.1 DUF3817 domain-containing protein [Tessaracoccus caeni]